MLDVTWNPEFGGFGWEAFWKFVFVFSLIVVVIWVASWLWEQFGADLVDEVDDGEDGPADQA